MRRGFSQIELLVAVAVIAFGFLSLISALTFGLRSDASQQQMEEAVSAARQVIDLARARNLLFKGPGGGPVASLPDPGFVPIGDPPFQNDQFPEGLERRVEIQDLSSNPATPEFRLKRLLVTVRYSRNGELATLTLDSWVRRP